jgi:hypothetical protein
MDIGRATRAAAVAILLGAVVLAACGDDGGSDGGAYSSPDEMAEELGCSDTFEYYGFTDDTASGVSLESGSCTFEGAVVSLDIAKDFDDEVDLTSLAAEALCQVGAISGVTEFVVAEGPGWVSTPEEPGDDELATTLADELDGKVSRFDC